MRCFVAVRLPSIVAALTPLVEELAACGAAVRWVRPASMHLTLKFLGEVPPSVLAEVCGALRVVRGRAFELRLGELGCFPGARSPRVFWAGIGGQAAELVELRDAVESALSVLGFRREQRPFHPHVTLARAKGAAGARALAGEMQRVQVPMAVDRVESLSLYESRLLPAGARVPRDRELSAGVSLSCRRVGRAAPGSVRSAGWWPTPGR